MTLDQQVAGLSLYRLRIPLLEPYHLAYGDLRAFDTILACLRTRDGDEAWGETTPLPGYSHHDVEGVWQLATVWGHALKGRRVADALSFLHERVSEAPFACAVFTTALESLAWCGKSTGQAIATESKTRHVVTGVPDAGPSSRVALVGAIRSTCPTDVENEARRLLDAGYSTLKLKIGTDVDADLANVSAAQRAIRNRGVLRIDANQGYSLEEGQKLLRRLDPAGIQLLEQPFPVARWDWMEIIGEQTCVPLMLDESVANEDDLRRASDIPEVRYVKFKLMRAGSITRLVALVDLASALGLGVIVGNGVATDIGCLHEAQVVADRLILAGEMNGFLKLAGSLLAEPLRLERSQLVVPPLGRVLVRYEQVDHYCVATLRL